MDAMAGEYHRHPYSDDLRSAWRRLSLRAGWVTCTRRPCTHTGAGNLLVTEAGGAVSDIDGRPWMVGSDSLVSSANQCFHEELLDIVRKTRG